MPKKRRNNGRNKNHKGHSDPIHCENCFRLCPKDKAIKRFLIKNMVDGSSKRDIEEVSIYNEGDEKYQMPKLYIKNQYCVSCGIHARIVRVRSTVDRRIRYVSRYRKDQISEMSKGLYRVANQRKGDKPVINKEE
jgi:small subunit ribosomal protein S26e